MHLPGPRLSRGVPEKVPVKAPTAVRGTSWSFETTISLVRVSPPSAYFAPDVVPRASFAATVSLNVS